jgi:hypothetical protein
MVPEAQDDESTWVYMYPSFLPTIAGDYIQPQQLRPVKIPIDSSFFDLVLHTKYARAKLCSHIHIYPCPLRNTLITYLDIHPTINDSLGNGGSSGDCGVNADVISTSAGRS